MATSDTLSDLFSSLHAQIAAMEKELQAYRDGSPYVCQYCQAKKPTASGMCLACGRFPNPVTPDWKQIHADTDRLARDAITTLRNSLPSEDIGSLTQQLDSWLAGKRGVALCDNVAVVCMRISSLAELAAKWYEAQRIKRLFD